MSCYADFRASHRSQRLQTDPDWLPDPSIDFSAPCLITLLFIDSGKELNRQERIHVDTRSGIIESTRADSGDRIFEVTLDETFAIEIEKIYVTVERGSNGAYRWKRTIPAHYQLNVETRCLDHQDSIHLLGLMEKKSASKYRGSLTEQDATLRATWYDLPECPRAGKLLPMLRMNGPEDTINMKYGVELSMGWSRKRDTPLTAWAKTRRAAIVPEQDQLPTPSASDESENAVKQHVVTYVFMNERSHTMENLKCPLCATGTSIRAHYEFSSFDRLHTHMLLWHDHFHPQIEDDKDDESPFIRKTVHLKLTGQPVGDNTQPIWDGDEDSWEAPPRAFDEKAYLRGEDTWTRHPKPRLLGRHEPGKAERPSLKATKKQSSTGSGLNQSIAVSARPELKDICDMPKKSRKAWPVPKVPGTRFYRTKSKRPFETNEYVSESDEDVDESWLQAHKRDDMSSLPLSAGAKDFYQDWNLAAAEDDFPADKLVGECLVRFTRRFQHKMGNDEYYEEFMKQADRLRLRGIIDSKVHEHCRDLERPDADMQDQQVAAQSQPGAASNAGAKTCSCGSMVASARAAMVCHDVVSLIPGTTASMRFGLSQY